MPAVSLGMLGAMAVSAAGSAYSARQSTRFAERSYRTRYQTTVKDLQKAGLNPMLAVQQSPGTPPQPDIPDYGDSLSRGAQAGSAAAIARSQNQLLVTQNELAAAQRNKTIAEGRAQEMTNLQTEASFDYQSAKKTLGDKGEVLGASAASQERTTAELKQISAQAEKLSQEASTARINNEIARGELTFQQARVKYADELAEIEVAYKRAMSTAEELKIPAAQAEAAFWKEAGLAGKALQFIKAIIGK